jgi:hypothetical protein
MMSRVLDAYCAEYAIDDPITRDEIGALLIKLFDSGVRTEEELATALKRQRTGEIATTNLQVR